MTWTTRQLNEIQQAAAREFMGDADVLGVRIRRQGAEPTLQITCSTDAGAVATRLPATFRGLAVVCREAQPMVLAYTIAQ